MFRIISLVVGLGAVSFAAYYFLTHGEFAQAPNGRSGPANTMDQARAKAHQLEVDEQKRVDQELQQGAAAEQQ